MIHKLYIDTNKYKYKHIHILTCIHRETDILKQILREQENYKANMVKWEISVEFSVLTGFP